MSVLWAYRHTLYPHQRLISPCLCRGTVAKVHVACLNRWRNRSPSSTSYFQCDQCKYRYRIKRAKIAGLAENKCEWGRDRKERLLWKHLDRILTWETICSPPTLTGVPVLDGAMTHPPTDALAGLTILAFVFLVFINGYIGNWILKQSTTDSFASLIFYTEPSDAGYHWHPSGTYLPLETVGQAVELASNLAEELRYTQDGGEEGGGSSDDSSLRPANDVAKNDEAEQTEASDSETSYRYVRPKMRRRNIRKKMVKRFRSIVSHFAVGVSFTGIGSFLWLLLTLPLWPFHPMRAGLFRTFRGREGRGAASPLGSVLLALFVVVGLVKSLHLCWKLTRKGAHFVLRRAENGILEVG